MLCNSNTIQSLHQQKTHTRIYLHIFARSVYVPEYIRWGDYYYSWNYLQNVGKQQCIAKTSFRSIVKLYKRTIFANQNIKHKSRKQKKRLIEWFNSPKLQNASFFYRILWVCNIFVDKHIQFETLLFFLCKF